VAACGFGDCGNLLNQILTDAQLAQSLGQQLDYRIEMRVIQAHCARAGVPIAHVFARIAMRSAERHGQEDLLLGPLPSDVDSVEKACDAFVGEHFAVKNVYRGFHGIVAA
jgi:hypothetical protein